MVCVPAARVEVVNCAYSSPANAVWPVALGLSAGVPSTVVTPWNVSEKVTEPVGAGAPFVGVNLRAAIRVTACPAAKLVPLEVIAPIVVDETKKSADTCDRAMLQLPLVQVALVGHTFPQAPQLLTSDWVSLQTLTPLAVHTCPEEAQLVVSPEISLY